MARKPGRQFPGAIYHGMNRGDHREAICLDEADREGFPKTPAQACEKTDWQSHAYCLMGSQFCLKGVAQQGVITTVPTFG